MNLCPTALLGKASNTDDFDLVDGTDRAQVPESVRALAGAWLQILGRTDNPFVAVLQRDQKNWWLLCGQKERGTDRAGRPLSYLTLGMLPEAPHPQQVPSLLLNIGKASRKAGRRIVEEVEAELTLADAPNEAIAHAALSLVTGGNGWVVDPREAATVLLTVSLDAVAWVALLPSRQTVNLPDGPGLVLSEDRPINVPPDLDDLLRESEPKTILRLPLAALAGVEHASPRLKRELARAGLGIMKDPFNDRLPLAALTWLARTAPGKRKALESIRREQIAPWLNKLDQPLEPSEIQKLQGKLGAEHREAVIAQLRGQGKDALQVYRDLYPDDREGLVQLLPEALVEPWQYLNGGHLAVAPLAVKELLEFIEETPLPDTLDLAGLSRAARTGFKYALKRFGRALVQRHLPQDVVLSLLNKGDPPARFPEEEPSLAPDLSWVQGLPPRPLLAARRWITASPSWNSWWVRCLELQAESGLLDPQEAFEVAAEVGLPELLRGAGAPAVVVQLADPGGPTVSLPIAPGAWDERANRLLVRLLHKDRLFDRLEGPVTPAALDWLARRLDEDGKAQVKQLREQLDEGRAIGSDWLRRHARLLDSQALLGQIAAWGTGPHERQRVELLGHLISQPPVAPALGPWLRAMLLECNSLRQMPRLSAEVMRRLLPLLDPIRDVVREVMIRTDVEEDERALLAAVFDRLRTIRSAPPPPPSADQRQRRPEWCQKLAELPGWEHWRPGAVPSGEIRRGSVMPLKPATLAPPEGKQS